MWGCWLLYLNYWLTLTVKWPVVLSPPPPPLLMLLLLLLLMLSSSSLLSLCYSILSFLFVPVHYYWKIRLLLLLRLLPWLFDRCWTMMLPLQLPSLYLLSRMIRISHWSCPKQTHSIESSLENGRKNAECSRRHTYHLAVASSFGCWSVDCCCCWCCCIAELVEVMDEFNALSVVPNTNGKYCCGSFCCSDFALPTIFPNYSPMSVCLFCFFLFCVGVGGSFVSKYVDLFSRNNSTISFLFN